MRTPDPCERSHLIGIQGLMMMCKSREGSLKMRLVVLTSTFDASEYFTAPSLLKVSISPSSPKNFSRNSENSDIYLKNKIMCRHLFTENILTMKYFSQGEKLL